MINIIVLEDFMLGEPKLLNAEQIDKLRVFEKRVNELLESKPENIVVWTDEELGSRSYAYQRIEKLGNGCPEKAAIAYVRVLIALQTEGLMRNAPSSKAIH